MSYSRHRYSQPGVNVQEEYLQPTSHKHFKKKRKRNKGGQEQRAVNLDDDYDPARPNEYEEFMQLLELHKEKLKQQKLNEIYDQKLNKPQNKQEQIEQEEPQHIPMQTAIETQREYVPPPVAEIPLDVSGEQAYLLRLQRSQQTEAHPPAQEVVPPTEDDDDEDDEDIDGIPLQIPSVLILKNIATQLTLSDPVEKKDLELEIREECVKFGNVTKCEVVLRSSDVVVKVEFEGVGCENARRQLQDRYFGGKRIDVEVE